MALSMFPTAKDTYVQLKHSSPAATETIVSDIDALTLAVILSNSTDFPPTDYILQIDKEELDIESNDTITGIQTVRAGGRGHGGTTASAHSANAVASNVWSSSQRYAIVDTLMVIEDAVWPVRKQT